MSFDRRHPLRYVTPNDNHTPKPTKTTQKAVAIAGNSISNKPPRPPQIRFTTHHFKGELYDSEHVIISFRRIGEMDKEHILNKLAVSWTQTRKERQTDGIAGSLCHCELLLQTEPNAWYAYSVNKMTGEWDAEAQKVVNLKPGFVHRKTVHHMQQYTHCCMRIPRDQQKRVFDFLEAQVGRPFNLYGYVLSIVPGLSWGVRDGSKLPENAQLECAFCSELILSALQYARVNGFEYEVPAKSNPNSIFRVCTRLFGFQGGANPVTMRELSLE